MSEKVFWTDSRLSLTLFCNPMRPSFIKKNSSKNIENEETTMNACINNVIKYDIEVWDVSNPNLWRIVRRTIRWKILLWDGNLSLDQVTKEDNISNKHYLYKPRDSYTEVWDKIYLKETLVTDQHFMTFRLTQNYHKKLCSYVNATYVM